MALFRVARTLLIEAPRVRVASRCLALAALLVGDVSREKLARGAVRRGAVVRGLLSGRSAGRNALPETTR